MALHGFPHLMSVVLLMTNCLHHRTTAQRESICVQDPELQILDKSIHDFNCQINETIHALNCSDLGVPALPKTDDTGVPSSIEIFDFSYNKIKCLPKINNTNPACSVADCYVGGCLQELRLQHNEIDFMHDEVFQTLTCLTSLDLSHNLLTNTTLRKHHFYRLNHLRHLDLHGNPLRTLPDNVLIFAHLSHLNTLNLSHCQLEKVGELAVDDFFELEVLDLSHNHLRRLSGRTFQGLMSLRVLDLRWNKLGMIEENTFGDMRNLEELRLDHNRLSFISELAFHRQAVLESLGLFSNQFSSLPYGALATLERLRFLDLSHNPLHVLKPGASRVNTSVQHLKLDHLLELKEVRDLAFNAFPHLTSLSLRYCPSLTTLQPRAFLGASDQLCVVRLDHNGLQHLPEDLLPWERLSLLTLDHNPWACDCRLAWAAGHPPGNTTVSCRDPPKLRGQELRTLTAKEMDCPNPIRPIVVIIVFSLTVLILTTLGLLFYQRKRRMFCWCLRGDAGSYVTVFTRENGGRGGGSSDDDDAGNGMCGDGDVDDLDLGSGSGGEGGIGGGGAGGRVRILMKSLTTNGYRLLKNKGGDGGESTQDLTSACDV
ncbi:uncharacterized protein LOC143297922 [Babylonia areolata]|uniref:uncharacterized protein LOC143297922 n=1 Tax=Babylonia areolata TaxID=304850 RepID=UPI003FD61651